MFIFANIINYNTLTKICVRSFSAIPNITSNNLKIAKDYPNFDTEKEKILNENRRKSGVYCFINKKKLDLSM